MPRDLQQTDRNELKIQDTISASELLLFYRLPTTPERIAFQKASFKRLGSKSLNTLPEARAEYGELILTGIREGDFLVGKQVISSDTNSPNYCPDWKKHIAATAGDLLMLLGMQVFEGSMEALIKAAGDTLDAETEGENILPLATSSNG